MRPPDTRHAPRTAFVFVLALLEVAAAIASIASYKQPIGTYGFLLQKDDVTISVVGRQSPAARAGIVPGDQLVYASLPLRGRRYAIFDEEVPGGAPITFQVIHDGRMRQVTLRAESAVAIGRTETFTYALAGLALGLVGLVLVLLRPSVMTWAFALVAPPLLIPYDLQFWSQEAQNGAAATLDAGIALLYAVQAAAIMLFASRFPDDRPAGVARVVDRLSVPVGVAVAIIYVYIYLDVRFSTSPPIFWLSLVNYAVVLPSAAALIALVATFLTASGGARSRLLPVIASFVFLIVTGVLQQLGTELTVNGAAIFALTLAYSASPALVAGAVAYGIVRHRVMDVSFIVSRTLVYTILTITAVALFSLIEFVFGKLLEYQRVATVLEIGAAILLGLSFNAMHRRIDDFVDRVLFRARHLAEERLNATARALPHAAGSAAVDAALVDDPADALGLCSAAIFRLEDDCYRRVHARGWEADRAGALSFDDRLVMQLRADLIAIDPHELCWTRSDVPAGAAEVIYAVPIVSDHQLLAIALYGGHTGGEDLDPDERAMLRRLGRAAAAGYDRIAAAQVRRQLERLELENATLRGVEKKLSELLERRTS